MPRATAPTTAPVGSMVNISGSFFSAAVRR
jgi:hypothetical protein